MFPTHLNMECFPSGLLLHYSDVVMGAMAPQITSVSIVYSPVCSGTGQRKHQSSASLAFVREITGDRWIPRTKGQYRGKCLHLMTSSWLFHNSVNTLMQHHHGEHGFGDTTSYRSMHIGLDLSLLRSLKLIFNIYYVAIKKHYFKIILSNLVAAWTLPSWYTQRWATVDFHEGNETFPRK